MKTIKSLMLATLLVVAYNSQAQVNINIGTKPQWAPKAPVTVKYYYLPDIQTYYDVPAQRYIYQNNGAWVRTAILPTRYRGYNLYRGQTIYLTDYKGNAPYIYYSKHKVKYVAKPWKANGHDNGNHYGQLKGKPNGNSNDKRNGKAKGHGKK